MAPRSHSSKQGWWYICRSNYEFFLVGSLLPSQGLTTELYSVECGEGSLPLTLEHMSPLFDMVRTLWKVSIYQNSTHGRRRKRIRLLPKGKEMRPVRWFVLHTHCPFFLSFYLHCCPSVYSLCSLEVLSGLKTQTGHQREQKTWQAPTAILPFFDMLYVGNGSTTGINNSRLSGSRG